MIRLLGCSFDIMKDQFGGPRSAFPHSLQFVASTQADNPRSNFIAFAKVSNLQQVNTSSLGACEFNSNANLVMS